MALPLRSHRLILTWLQIIARIQTPNAHIRRNINNLLTDVGRHHPQALIYPLTVASKSNSALRHTAALNIMDRMREHSPSIVEQVCVRYTELVIPLTVYQALIVSRELIRVAILWHEQWFEGLEEASRYYFNDHNPDGMIAHLEPLHNMVEAVSMGNFNFEANPHCTSGTENRSRNILRTGLREGSA